MIDSEFIKKLKDACCGGGSVLIDEPMSKHTSFRTGGPADAFVTPENAQGISEGIRLCRDENIPFFIMGNGSNLLASDKGYRGVVICTQKLGMCGEVSEDGRHLASMSLSDKKLVSAGAGVKLSALTNFALQRGLAGLEFAAGIPGTVGGAVVMNAGAYGGEIKDALLDCDLLTKEGGTETIAGPKLDLSYRHSNIPEKESVVLCARFCLRKGDPAEIKEKMDDFAARRKKKQPLEFPSAGSTFKRPKGYFAGKLIQEAGLAGYRIGGCSVSKKHCGFVVNDKGATSSEIYKLICDVQKKVYETHGVNLTMEVKLIGDFS